MPKKFKLTGDFSPEYTVIGISSQAKGYKLAMVVNETLEFHFKRVEDFHVPGKNEVGYTLYQDQARDSDRIYYLLYNRHVEGMLVPLLKGIDALLVIYDSLSGSEINLLLGALRKGKGVQAAYEIKVESIKDFDHLLEDLEVHLMNMKKPAED